MSQVGTILVIADHPSPEYDAQIVRPIELKLYETKWPEKPGYIYSFTHPVFGCSRNYQSIQGGVRQFMREHGFDYRSHSVAIDGLSAAAYQE